METLTVAVALAAGLCAQAVARRLQLPALALLLTVGVLLGPDVIGVVRPQLLGEGLLMLVGFSVAVILFEGGMGLDVQRLKREGRSIRRLVTLGGLITVLGAAAAANLVLGWDLRQSALFGALVMVTGPTVINPLLQRLRVERSVATVLRAEGVLIDAIGAIVAMVALEVAISPTGTGVAKGLLHVATGLGLGSLAGLAAGFLLALLLRRSIIPEGLENVFILSMVFALFAGANAVVPESGIAAVTIAGIVVGNTHTRVQRDLMAFKEQLTIMLLGMLFVLLAADVRLAQVYALGAPGLLVVGILMFVVRPLSVHLSTAGSDYTWRQRAFVAWIGPRGIVAAAVSSFVAVELDRRGIGGGQELRALVFLVIAVTVLTAGFTGGPIASLLGLRRRRDEGWAVLGANPLSRALCHAMKKSGQDIVALDTNPHACRGAQEEGLRTLHGNGLEERLLGIAEIEARKGALAISPNDEVNLLFLQKVREQPGPRRLYAVIGRSNAATTRAMLEQLGGAMLFGRPTDVDQWSARMARDGIALEHWHLNRAEPIQFAGLPAPLKDLSDGVALALTVTRNGNIEPITDQTQLADGDELLLALSRERYHEAIETLTSSGLSKTAPSAESSESEPGDSIA